MRGRRRPGSQETRPEPGPVWRRNLLGTTCLLTAVAVDAIGRFALRTA